SPPASANTLARSERSSVTVWSDWAGVGRPGYCRLPAGCRRGPPRFTRPDTRHRHKGRCDDAPRSDPGAWRNTVVRRSDLDMHRMGGPHMKAATISTTGNEATAWHAIAADDVARRLNTNTETGLDAAEIPQRLAKYGPNRLPEAARRGPFM